MQRYPIFLKPLFNGGKTFSGSLTKLHWSARVQPRINDLGNLAILLSTQPDCVKVDTRHAYDECALQACRMLHSLLSLETLDCSCLVGPSHYHLQIIAELPRLKHLVIRGNYKSNDVSLAILARLTRLTSLHFSHAKVR